ncbi:MAG: peroxidase [Pseudomonadota bacterium]
MTFIKTVSPRDATGDVREMYKRQDDFWGFVPNYAKVFSHRTEALARWGRLLAELRRPTDDRRFELVTFVAAHGLKNNGCTLVHGTELASFIGEEAVVAIADGREADVLPDADVAIVRFARQITQDATKVTSGMVDSLKYRHDLTDADVFDIAALAAGRAFFAKLLDALGVETDSAWRELDKDFRENLNIGRPMDPRPPESLPSEHAA